LGPVEAVEGPKNGMLAKFGFVKKTANTLSKSCFWKSGDVVQCGTALRIELRRCFNKNVILRGC
jgi:hypothetical protein